MFGPRGSRLVVGLAALGAAVLVAPPVAAQEEPAPVPGGAPSVVASEPAGADGRIDVVVQLATPPLAAVLPPDALASGALPSPDDQRAHLAAVAAEQEAVAAQLSGLGALERARVDTSLNALVVTIDARQIDAALALPEVRSIHRVRDSATYQSAEEPANQTAEGSGSLAAALEYVGASALHDEGFDGTGVRVAVVDSGIDYTHANLGGPDDSGLYSTCYGPAAQPGATSAAKAAPSGECAEYFGPDAPKVTGGVDLVGDTWPNGALAPDPNPIDRFGHGTHVADILAGRSADGSHVGLAPGADLLAVKVCSSVTSACSGIALLQAVDHVLDPNNDGNVDDAVDIVNLSLGSDYGEGDDDLVTALSNATNAGVLVVSAAGNGGDRPFNVASPSNAPGVLSVAETAMPDERTLTISVVSPTQSGIPGNEIDDVRPQAWSPALARAITARALSPNPATGCASTDYGSFLSGAIAVVRRGGCDVSQKSDAARQAGAVAIVVVNTADGPAPTYSPGAGQSVPTLSTSRSYGNALIAAIGSGPVTLALDPARGVRLANSMAATSSRGPTGDGSLVKPDLGAPGGWQSAVAGTGAAEARFAGTSGAAPVVAGAAALLLDRTPTAPPEEIGALLTGGADGANRTYEADGTSSPTPVARIGAGELRVDGAAALRATARAESGSLGLAFGMVDAAGVQTVARRVVVRNLTTEPRTYTVDVSMRDPLDATTGALRPLAPGQITVEPLGTTTFSVAMALDSASLRDWPLTGLAGASAEGGVLTAPELDGTVTLTSGDERIRLPWQLSPRKSSALKVADALPIGPSGSARLKVRNLSATAPGRLDVFSLTGTSEPTGAEPNSSTDLAAVGVRNDDTNVQFAIATYGRRALPLVPDQFVIRIDTNGDGQADREVFNTERAGDQPTGQDVVAVQTLAGGPNALGTRRGGAAVAHYFSIADVHSATTVFTVPLAALGVGNGSTLGFDVAAYDRTGTGGATDRISGQTFTLGSPRYRVADGIELSAPVGGTTRLTVEDTASTAPSTQSGLLLLTPADAVADFRVVAVLSPPA